MSEEKSGDGGTNQHTQGGHQAQATVPSVGRIVHVYSPEWSGPRAGIITGLNGKPSPTVTFNVTVFPDMLRDKKVRGDGAHTWYLTSLTVQAGTFDPSAVKIAVAVWPPRA